MMLNSLLEILLLLPLLHPILHSRVGEEEAQAEEGEDKVIRYHGKTR